MTDHRATATVTTLAPRRPGGVARAHRADTAPAAVVLRTPLLSHLLDPGGVRMVLGAVLSGTPVVAEFIDGRRYRLDLGTTDAPAPVPPDAFADWLARHLQDTLARLTLDADRYRVRVTRCEAPPAADEVSGRASA